MSTIHLGNHALDTFSIHERRLHLTHHPDGGDGQVVLVAVYGTGDSPFGGKHDLCICMDDASRKRLIEILQAHPDSVAGEDAHNGHITDEYGDCVHWCPRCGPQCKHGNNSLECLECQAEMVRK